MTDFPLPDPAVARHPNVLLAPRALTRWLEDLPLGNPARSAEQMLHQLRLLVRDPQPGTRLTSLLDCYTPTLDRLRQIIDARLPTESESALPLDQLELLVLDLVVEQAFGYLRACNVQFALGKAPSLALLYPAAKLLDEAATLASLHYHRSPQPQWRLLLHTYLLAEQLQLDRQPLNPRKSLENGSDTIHGIFFCALLVACCDPFHHRPAQLAGWHAWLQRHTGPLSLAPLPQGNAAIPVDISGELTPLAAARTAKPGAATRYVIADGLLKALEDDPEAPAGLHATLTALVHGRRAREQRDAPRESIDQPYQLVLGLHNVAARLLSLANQETHRSTQTINGRQVNRSTTGAAFVLNGPLQNAPSIGEPVLAEANLNDTSKAAVGFLARVRRVVFETTDKIEVGVEKLPGRVTPISITGNAAERARGDVSALLLDSSQQAAFTLIAAKRIYREGDIVTVEGPNIHHTLRMLRQSGGNHRVAYIDVEVLQG